MLQHPSFDNNRWEKMKIGTTNVDQISEPVWILRCIAGKSAEKPPFMRKTRHVQIASNSLAIIVPRIARWKFTLVRAGAFPSPDHEEHRLARLRFVQNFSPRIRPGAGAADAGRPRTMVDLSFI